MKRSRDVNVFGFLKHIRSQRNYLVQTEVVKNGVLEDLRFLIAASLPPYCRCFYQEQYIFIHDALLEAIESEETEVGLPYLGRYLQSLQTSGDVDRNSLSASLIPNGDPCRCPPPTPTQQQTHPWQLLERQYRRVTAFEPKDFQVASARKVFNEGKNRDPSLVPVEAYRVLVTTKPGIEGSDYVNATFLQVLNSFS